MAADVASKASQVSVASLKEFENYKVEHLISGKVYKVKNEKGDVFAAKVEDHKKGVAQSVKYDVLVLTEASESKTKLKHFCKLVGKGLTKKKLYVVMTFQGPSLHDLRKAAPDRKFSFGCAIRTSMQLLEAIQELHEMGFLHRDVKPSNFVVGYGSDAEIRKFYMINFSTTRRFVKEGGERKARKKVSRKGSIKYSSVQAHGDREVSRNDDLESWLYISVEMTSGSLPWDKMKENDKVMDMKLDIRRDSDKAKAFFKDCPDEFEACLNRIDSGAFYNAPKYALFHANLQTALDAKKCKVDKYDWEDAEFMKRCMEETNLMKPPT